MSRIGNFVLELQEFVYPLVYQGLSNEQITEMWKEKYKRSDMHDMGLMYINGAIKTAHSQMYGQIDFDEPINREV
jgi:hypothetical protein